jgi:hypothetical protein
MRPPNVISTVMRSVAAALLLAMPGSPGMAQTPPAPGKATSQTGSYVVEGSLTDADLDRLLAAIRKLSTIEQAEIKRFPGSIVLKVKGSAQGTILLTAARSAGFRLSQMPVRTYVATGPTQDTDVARLRETIEKLPGIEQVEVGKQTTGAALRIRGAVEASTVAAAARPSGFELQMVTAYVASGAATERNLARLREALNKVPGTDRVEMRSVVNGAALLVYGDVHEAGLSKAASTVGYSLLTVSDPASNIRRFAVRNEGAIDEGKLLSALNAVGGIGEVRIRNTPEGMRVGITNGATQPSLVVAGAKAAGFDLEPIESVSVPSLDADGERNTPPAPNERTIEELTKIGEIAPDFTLVTKDGKAKVTLADYRGKKPVVLIFGSYT